MSCTEFPLPLASLYFVLSSVVWCRHFLLLLFQYVVALSDDFNWILSSTYGWMGIWMQFWSRPRKKSCSRGIPGLLNRNSKASRSELVVVVAAVLYTTLRQSLTPMNQLRRSTMSRTTGQWLYVGVFFFHALQRCFVLILTRPSAAACRHIEVTH